MRTLPCAAALLLLCSKDYDPFSDLTNAKVHVLSWDFAGKDSVALYTTATLKVVVALREEVDSFEVYAEKNRFWRNSVIRGTAAAPMSRGPYSFSISFFDTGAQHVLLKTYRSNGEFIQQDLAVRVVSPLRQQNLDGFFGRKIALATSRVGDSGIFYHWMFGRTLLDSSVSPQTEITLPIFTPASDTGWLWVTDFSSKHPTPACPFLYAFRDTTHPTITCINEGLQGDTIVTRDTLLVFKANIIDSVETKTDSCSVNNSSFDFVNSATHVFTKLFPNLPDLTKNGTLLRLDVVAIDNFQFNNMAKRTFWARFTPGGATTSDIHVEFLIPQMDRYYTSSRECSIAGRAQNFRGGAIRVSAKINGIAIPDPKTIADSGMWNWGPLPLDSIFNTVTVSAYSPSSLASDSAQRIIIYDPNVRDTIPPLIYEMTIDGRQADRLDTSADSVALGVVAFDDHPGLQELKIQGRAAKPDTTDLIWSKYVYIWSSYAGPLTHSVLGNKVSVVAIDSNDNRDSAFVTIYKNSPPLLVKDPGIPPRLCSDSADTFQLSMFDADADKITIQTVHAPLKMSVSSSGRIIWNPSVSDTGFDSLVLSLSDTFTTILKKQPKKYLWNFSCVRCAQPLPLVRFTTSAADFPGVLQAITDTLRITLAVDSVRLLPMLRFSAWFTDNDERIMDNSASARLLWVPTQADTGKRQLLITVGNGTNAFDTIKPVMTIVPKNQYPCSLSYRFTGTIDTAGALDLFSHPAPETLYFSIRDEDNIATEHYTVTVTQHGVSTVETIKNRDFYLTLKPDSTKNSETVQVSILDATGTRDSITFTIDYKGRAPDGARRLYLNTTANGAGVMGNVLKFPILVRLTRSNFDFAKAQSGGENVRFLKSNGTSLPYQIEQWDSAAGLASIWVLADTVYGNDSGHYMELYQVSLPAVDGSNSAAVFDVSNGYQGVWHLGESGATLRDATANGFNGRRMGNQRQDAGIIGSGQVFDGFSSYTDMGNILNPGNSNFTISLWVKRGAEGGFPNPNDYSTLIGKTNGGNPNANYGWLLQFDNMDKVHCFMATAGGPLEGQWGNTGAFDFSSNATVTNITQWHYVCAIINRSSNNECKLYIDGAEASVTQRGFISSVGNLNNTVALRIGVEADNQYYFNGSLDEAIVSFTVRSADWIRLCYMNQKAADALVVFK